MAFVYVSEILGNKKTVIGDPISESFAIVYRTRVNPFDEREE